DHPTLLHDISFQLSFLSYLLLSASMRLRPDWHWSILHPRVQSRVLAGAMGVVRGAMLNLWVTFIILIGLTPLISAVFGQVSFLVFLGNLLMVPLMALVILPLGLLVLSASLWALGTPVEGVFERLIFSVADPVLRLWVRLAEILDALGAPLVRDYRLIWTPGQFFLYYLLLGIALIGMGRLSRRNTVHFKAPH
ncbi:MAG: ComEC/Rec2 family competence protein, partial [Deltaproteobacteria bacterium]|nr:ComEC/Rec2 family competence protein [Deltaproteobacteria bacterium]